MHHHRSVLLCKGDVPHLSLQEENASEKKMVEHFDFDDDDEEEEEEKEEEFH